jgi:hypothetical protein
VRPRTRVGLELAKLPKASFSGCAEFRLCASSVVLVHLSNHGTMSDPRFARLKQDPRFRRIRKKDKKVVVDDRFKSVFSVNEEKKSKSVYPTKLIRAVLDLTSIPL